MIKYQEKTQNTCFYELRRKGSLPLLNMNQSINVYKNLYEKKPLLGMDIKNIDFKADGFAILQNKGKENISIPLCCSHYILILNLKGKSLRHINQYSYETNAHSLQLLVPGIIYSFEDLSESCESLMVFFEYEFLSSLNTELLEFFSRKFEVNQLDQEHFIQILRLFKLLNQEYKNKKLDYQEYSKTLLIQILYLLKREKSAPFLEKVKTRSQQILKHFLALIEENFQTKKSVQEYADILGLTPKHLSETIKESTNESALFLIHKRIIKEIQYQLCYTTLSIKEISSSLYFSNSSDFGRFFKRYKLISPKSYRLKFQV
ncbi:MAG: helix-turn-helix domain-containing protein [Campylobacteraceae bacterium]|nr:helix-turn-helix domain-containing protein [Campylobacteraceae bacterium]